MKCLDRRLLIIAGLVAVTLVLDACGDSSPQTMTKAAVSESTETTEVPPASAIKGVAPAIEHSLELRFRCLLCHRMKGETEVPYPDSHIGQSEDVCMLHHALAGSGDTPAPITTATTQEPEPAVSSGGLPKTPHSLEGRDDCLMCHASGSQQVPESHADYTSDVCQGCHMPE